jgi:hypothetical protein
MNELKQTVNSICENIQGLSETIEQHAIEREKSGRKLLNELDKAILKAKNTVCNLQKATL